MSNRKTALPLSTPIHLDEWCDGMHGPCACADQHNENHAWGHWRGGSVLSLRDVLLAFGERVKESCATILERKRDSDDRRYGGNDPAHNAMTDAAEVVRAVDVARLLEEKVDPEAAWTKGNIP